MIWWGRGNGIVGAHSGAGAVVPAIKGKGAGNSAGPNFFRGKVAEIGYHKSLSFAAVPGKIGMRR